MARDFTPAEDRVILLAYEEMECDWPAIGAALDRPWKSIKSRYRLLLDTLDKASLEAVHTGPALTSQRDCLRCEQPFDSRGPGHRICDTCGSANAKVWHFGHRPLHEVVTAVRNGVDAPIASARSFLWPVGVAA